MKGNTRFALSVQEKRPFFLEGSDLYSQPFGLIYTVRSPTRCGARVPLIAASADAAVLTVKDRGGGFVILPGTYFSDAREQGASQARWRGCACPTARAAAPAALAHRFPDRTYDDGSSNRPRR